MSWLDSDRPGSGPADGDGRSIGGNLHVFQAGKWVPAQDSRPRPSHYAGNCRCVVVPIALGSWPQDVTVPPAPMRGRPTVPPPGEEEGVLCLRTYSDGRPVCLGVMELRRDADLGGCHCWKYAPCSSCMSQVPECTLCGHREPEPC